MDYSFPTFRRLAFSWGPPFTTRAQSRAVLRLIAIAVEDNLPLAPLLESWAADERGVQKGRLLRLVRLLNGGTPLPSALEEVSGVLREEDLLAIRFDAQSGTRTAAIRAILDEDQPHSNARGPGVWGAIVYFCVVAPLGLLCVAFTQFKIVPMLGHILNSFSVPEPQVLHWSRHLGGVFMNTWWLIALIVLALLSLLLLTRTGRFIRRTTLGRLFNPWRESYAADVLAKLGIAINAGKPISGALSTLARYHFDPAIRHKLLFVRNEVEQGADVWQSMAAAGLLTLPEVHLLETAERVGNRPWALKQLACAKTRRTSRRWDGLSVLLLPGLVLAMGILVLFQALTVFLPLTEILRTL